MTNGASLAASKDTRLPPSKIPVRRDSLSQSRSSSPTAKVATSALHRRAPSPTSTSSKIPVPVSTASKGAFRFFTSADRSGVSKVPSTAHSGPVPSKANAQVSPFAPISHQKSLSSPQKATPSAKHHRSELPISDDDESETSHLQEDDLKVKLREQKRFGKKTGELLNKLHENYEELLEKYAQAENTIDQLRFQPKLVGDLTPPSNASEVRTTTALHPIHARPTLCSSRAPCTSSNNRG